MKTRIAILLLIICCVCKLSAQKINITVTGGYGTYLLSDVKDIQKQMAKYYSGLQICPVQQFPGYLFYSAAIDYPVDKKNYLGLTYDYYMTGGRNSQIDYSGEYRLDMPLNAYAFGVNFKRVYYDSGRFHLYTRYKFGIIRSKLEIKESIDLYDVDSYANNESVVSKAYSIEPSIGAFYDINDNFSLIGSVGYDLNFGYKAFLDNSIKIDWSGFRLRAGLVYKIGYNK